MYAILIKISAEMAKKISLTVWC